MPDNEPRKEGVAGYCNHIPSLAVAINSDFLTNPYGDPPTGAVDKELIKKILGEIWAVLNAGLDPVWTVPEATCICPQCSESASPDSPDERWARLVTEMLAYTPYSGPGGQYWGAGAESDKIFFQKLVSDDPAYPIVAACQQLSTIGAITLGFFQLAQSPLDAASASPVTGVGGKLDDSSGQEVRKAIAKGLTPGSTYVTTAFRHIAFVLRIRDGRIQLFDTSAMRPPLPEKPKPKALSMILSGQAMGSGGNYDYGWLDRMPLGCRHWGILPQPAPQQLQEGIAKMQTARPVGLARLVLREVGAEAVLFATPLLLMYGKDGSENYSITRYMNSLRYMTGRDKVEALWFIFIPIGRRASKTDLLKQVLGERSAPADSPPPRERSLRQMVEEIRTIRGDANWQPAYITNYQCVTVLSTSPDVEVNQKKNHWVRKSSTRDGLVIVRHRYVSAPASDTRPNRNFWLPGSDPGKSSQETHDQRINDLIRLPWDQTSGSISLSAEDYSRFPYFSGQ